MKLKNWWQVMANQTKHFRLKIYVSTIILYHFILWSKCKTTSGLYCFQILREVHHLIFTLYPQDLIEKWILWPIIYFRHLREKFYSTRKCSQLFLKRKCPRSIRRCFKLVHSLFKIK